MRRDQGSLVESGRYSRDLFELWRTLQPIVGPGLRVADRLRQYLAELYLRLRRFSRNRFLPVSHVPYMGMMDVIATTNRSIWEVISSPFASGLSDCRPQRRYVSVA